MSDDYDGIIYAPYVVEVLEDIPGQNFTFDYNVGDPSGNLNLTLAGNQSIVNSFDQSQTASYGFTFTAPQKMRLVACSCAMAVKGHFSCTWYKTNGARFSVGMSQTCFFSIEKQVGSQWQQIFDHRLSFANYQVDDMIPSPGDNAVALRTDYTATPAHPDSQGAYDFMPGNPSDLPVNEDLESGQMIRVTKGIVVETSWFQDAVHMSDQDIFF